MVDSAHTGYKRVIGAVLEVGEDIAYFLIAALLLVIAFIILGQAVVTLWGLPSAEGAQPVVLDVLDLLLLVFIVVELLFAVRATISRRELVAEPFLLVGVIASVKEIVVLSVKAPDVMGTDKFTDLVLSLAALGGLVLVLSLAAWLLRIKEREPREASNSGMGADIDEAGTDDREGDRQSA